MDLFEVQMNLPISAAFRSQLLLSSLSTRPILGPLVLNPIPNAITHLLSPPSYLYKPFYKISISLASYLPLPFTPLYSLRCCLPLQVPTFPISILHNCIELFHCPGNFSIFFPTGENSDQVRFLLFSLKNSNLHVSACEIYVASCKFNHHVLRILVILLVDSSFELSTLGGNSSCAVGYLMVCTMYSVNWFAIKVKRQVGSSKFCILLKKKKRIKNEFNLVL